MERKLLALLAHLPESGISLVSKSNLNETPLNRYDCLKPTECTGRSLTHFIFAFQADLSLAAPREATLQPADLPHVSVASPCNQPFS